MVRVCRRDREYRSLLTVCRGSSRPGLFRGGAEGTYVPFTYEDATGRLTGFDVDIAVAIAQRLGVQLEFVEDKWDEPRAIDLALQPGSVPTL